MQSNLVDKFRTFAVSKANVEKIVKTSLRLIECGFLPFLKILKIIVISLLPLNLFFDFMGHSASAKRLLMRRSA